MLSWLQTHGETHEYEGALRLIDREKDINLLVDWLQQFKNYEYYNHVFFSDYFWRSLDLAYSEFNDFPSKLFSVRCFPTHGEAKAIVNNLYMLLRRFYPRGHRIEHGMERVPLEYVSSKMHTINLRLFDDDHEFSPGAGAYLREIKEIIFDERLTKKEKATLLRPHRYRIIEYLRFVCNKQRKQDILDIKERIETRIAELEGKIAGLDLGIAYLVEG